MKRQELELLITIAVMAAIAALLLVLGACAPSFPVNTSDGVYCSNVNQHETFINKTKADSESFKACISRGGVPKTGSHSDAYGHNFLVYEACEWPPTPREAQVEKK